MPIFPTVTEHFDEQMASLNTLLYTIICIALETAKFRLCLKQLSYSDLMYPNAATKLLPLSIVNAVDMFLARNTSMLTCSADSLFCKVLTILPSWLKNLSDSILMPQISRYLWTNE